MLNSILVPIDGSPFAEQALGIALGLARRDKAALELVQVHQPMPSVLIPHNAPVHDPQLDYDLRKDARTYLESIPDRLERGTVDGITTTLLEGAVLDSLLEHIRETAPDLVVMTTHARGGLSRAWMGSVADRLVRHAPAPVLLLRPGASSLEHPPDPPFSRVLIPLDGTPAGDEIIPHAIAVAGTSGVEYTLFRVLRAGTPQSGTVPRRGEEPDTPTLRATVETSLNAKAEALAAQGLSVKVRLGVHDDTARAILEYADERGADLIAMVTRSRGGLERFLMGSVADKVVRGADRSVLLLNPLEPPHGRP